MKIILISLLCIILILYFYPFFQSRELKNVIQPYKKVGNFSNIIFRNIKNKTVNKYQYDICHKKFLDLNPDFTIIWLSDQMCELFINKYFAKKVFQAYQTLKPGAFKSDLCRLCLLYRYGGVYFDAYVNPFLSIKDIIKEAGNVKFISVLDNEKAGSGIHNGFIMSTRKHPFLKRAINDIVKNVENRYYGTHGLSITGPLLLKNSIEKLTNKKPKEGLNQNDNSLDYYLFRHNFGPYQYITKKDKKIMSKTYSFLYYLYRKSLNSAYGKMYNKRDIYVN